jgi:hypothetical protein
MIPRSLYTDQKFEEMFDLYTESLFGKVKESELFEPSENAKQEEKKSTKNLKKAQKD